MMHCDWWKVPVRNVLIGGILILVGMTSIDFLELYRREKAKARQAKIPSLFMKRESCDLEKYKLTDEIFYCEDFVTIQEEKALIDEIYKNKEKWVQLSNRRLQNWGGTPYHGDGMIREDFPRHFKDVAKMLEASFGFSKDGVEFDQVLLNEYSNGKGIDFHCDGPLYKPIAVVLSLMTSSLIEFRREKKDETVYSVFLKPRSLLIFRGEKYSSWVHGIIDQKEDLIDSRCLNGKVVGESILRGDTRLSLTIRSAMKSKERIFTEEESKELERRQNWWLNSINEKKF